MLTINEIRKATNTLLDSYGFFEAILFGSYASGVATENSDVDVYVKVPKGTKTKQVFAFAYDLGKELGVDVDAYGSHEVPEESNFFKLIHDNGVAL